MYKYIFIHSLNHKPRHCHISFFAGDYEKYLTFWMKHYKLNKTLVVINGENFKESPWEEVQRLESFLGLDRRIAKDNFHFSRDKGFYCFCPQGGCDEQSAHCLKKIKGHKSLDTGSQYLPKKLYDFYKERNLRLFNIIGQKFAWNVEENSTEKQFSL